MTDPIVTYTPEKIAEARTRAAMAAMVDTDTFLLALDDIERLVRNNMELAQGVVNYAARVEQLEGAINSFEHVAQELGRKPFRLCCDSDPEEEHEEDCPFFKWREG